MWRCALIAWIQQKFASKYKDEQNKIIVFDAQIFILKQNV